MNFKNVISTIPFYGLTPNKKLGQNFLFDSGIIDRIVSIISNLSSKVVLEIGAGPGGLTNSLLQFGAKKVIAVEIDPRCIKILNELASGFPDKLEVLNTDAIKLKEEALGYD